MIEQDADLQAFARALFGTKRPAPDPATPDPTVASDEMHAYVRALFSTNPDD
ncbi:MAG: hypothetical protein ACQEWM_06035 [Actinomycetota bacterium]